jgi:hypothetical protein
MDTPTVIAAALCVASVHTLVAHVNGWKLMDPSTVYVELLAIVAGHLLYRLFRPFEETPS